MRTCPAGCLHSSLTLEASGSCRAMCMAPVNFGMGLQAQVLRDLPGCQMPVIVL